MVDSYRVLRPAAEMIVDTVAVEAAQSTGTVIRTGGVALATLLVTFTFSAVAGLAFWLGPKLFMRRSGCEPEAKVSRTPAPCTALLIGGRVRVWRFLSGFSRLALGLQV